MECGATEATGVMFVLLLSVCCQPTELIWAFFVSEIFQFYSPVPPRPLRTGPLRRTQPLLASHHWGPWQGPASYHSASCGGGGETLVALVTVNEVTLVALVRLVTYYRRGNISSTSGISGIIGVTCMGRGGY